MCDHSMASEKELQVLDVASKLVAIPGFEEDFENMIKTIKYDIPKTALSEKVVSQEKDLINEKRQSKYDKSQSKFRQKLINRLQEGRRKLQDELITQRTNSAQKIKELESTIADLEKKELGQRLSATKLRKEGQFKSKKLDKKGKDIDELKEEVSSLKDKLTLKEKQLVDKMKELNTTKKLAKESEKKYVEANKVITDKKEEIASLRVQLTSSQKQLEGALSELNMAKKLAKESEKKFIETKFDVTSLKGRLNEERRRHSKEKEQLEMQLVDERTKYKELAIMHENLQESHADLKQRFVELMDSSIVDNQTIEDLQRRIEKMQNEHATRLEEIRDGKLDTDERQLLQLQTQYNAVKTRVDAQERVLELVEYRKIQEIGDKMKKAKTMEEIEPLEKELKAALGRVQQIVGEKEQLMKDAKKRILRDAMRIRNNSIRSGTWKTVIKALFFVLILSMNLIMTQNLAAGRRQELEDYVSGTSNNANLFRMMLNGKNINPDNAINTMLENDGTPQQLVNDMLNGKYNTKKDDEKISDDEARPVIKDREFNIVDKAINNLNPVRFENPVDTWLGEHQGYSRDDFKGMVLKLLKERGVDLQNPDDREVRRKIREAINDVLKTDPDPLPEIDEVDAVPKTIRY